MTRDIRLSIEQLAALVNLMGPIDKITVDMDFAAELRAMLTDALNNSDSDTLNDFTA